MGYVAPILQLVGTGAQAYGQYKGGKNASDVYKYNQQMAKYRAQYAKDRGELEVQRLERDVGRAISRKKAIAGKSGMDTGSGSNLDVLDKIRREGAFDAEIIRYNANAEAWAAEQNVDLLDTQADQFYNAGLLSASTTILNSASRYDWQNAFKQKPKKPPASRYVSRYGSSPFGTGPGV